MGRSIAIIAAVGLTFGLAACGSNASDVRESAIDEMTQGLTDSGASQAVIDCMVGLINSYSDDDIVALDSDNASQELQDKFQADAVACASAE
ncbi:MAG: hypothetical protein Q7V58_07595 [Actinomycetota bacterium]|nr:hypothetical protein [Actinomycetota bacterium]